MGYLSFDASIKICANGRWHCTKTNLNGSKTCGTGGIEGYIHHVARDADRVNGIEVEHSNPNIDPAETSKNITYYKDEHGLWQRCTDSKQLRDAYDRLFEEVKTSSSKAIRKDAVTVRPVVVQVDPATYGDRFDDFLTCCVAWMEKTYDPRNVLGFSVHVDETSLHLHAMIGTSTERMVRERLYDPDGNPLMTKKGHPRYGNPVPTGELTFDQKAIYSGPQALAAMHLDFREFLIENGFEIELENRPLEDYLVTWVDKNGNTHQKGLTPRELEKISNLKIALKTREMRSKVKEKELDRRETQLDTREALIADREKHLEYNKARSMLVYKTKRQEALALLQTATDGLDNAASAYRKATPQADQDSLELKWMKRYPSTRPGKNRTLHDDFEEDKVQEEQRKREELRQQEERARSRARRAIALSQVLARHDIADEDKDVPDFDFIA